MAADVHGHAVLEMMMADGPQPRAALLRAIDARFGADARFHTCSAAGMTASQLLDFLAARGKYVETAGGLEVQRDRLCRHGDDAHHHEHEHKHEHDHEHGHDHGHDHGGAHKHDHA
jgi:probable metal-binding protein